MIEFDIWVFNEVGKDIEKHQCVCSGSYFISVTSPFKYRIYFILKELFGEQYYIV